nr:hypothetical protein [Mycoplasmopsis bovis]
MQKNISFDDSGLLKLKNHLTRLKDMEQLKRHQLEHLITTDVKQIHILKILI